MSIVLLCPTRKRPEQLKRMIASARKTAMLQDKGKIGIVVGVSEEDYESYGIINIGSHPFFSQQHSASCITFPDGLPTAHKWNRLAELAMKNPETKLFMLAADDMIFTTPGWDKALLDHYNGLENKVHVYALLDSRDVGGVPHPIVTREYIEAMGYFVPPIFLHWFVDSWTVAIAKANNCFTHFNNYMLVHDKPSDKGDGDETHNRIRQWGWHERDVYVNATCQSWKELQTQRLKCILEGKHPDLASTEEFVC